MSGIMARPFERPCRLIRWEPWPFDNQALIGHAAVSFNGWTVHRIPLFRSAGGRLIVGTPNAAVRVRSEWSRQIIEAVKVKCPELFT